MKTQAWWMTVGGAGTPDGYAVGQIVHATPAPGQDRDYAQGSVVPLRRIVDAHGAPRTDVRVMRLRIVRADVERRAFTVDMIRDGSLPVARIYLSEP